MIHTTHVAGHTAFQHIVGIGLVPQQLSQFSTQVDESLTDLDIILGVIVDTLRILRHIELTAQFALGAIGHEREVTGEVEGEHPPFQIHLLRRQGSSLTGGIRQTVELQ